MIRAIGYVNIGPGAKLAGGVTVGEMSSVGVGANLIPYLKIGRNVSIEAGTTILKNIPDNVGAIENTTI